MLGIQPSTALATLDLGRWPDRHPMFTLQCESLACSTWTTLQRVTFPTQAALKEHPHSYFVVLVYNRSYVASNQVPSRCTGVCYQLIKGSLPDTSSLWSYQLLPIWMTAAPAWRNCGFISLGSVGCKLPLAYAMIFLHPSCSCARTTPQGPHHKHIRDSLCHGGVSISMSQGIQIRVVAQVVSIY